METIRSIAKEAPSAVEVAKDLEAKGTNFGKIFKKRTAKSENELESSDVKDQLKISFFQSSFIGKNYYL